mmetsp:Transcript_21809/g.52739  ORF Transcript_21809/g.52739 Transcript_21809/m.52739 type:complete len:160 (-) Transcript_21809:1903-2382(-)
MLPARICMPRIVWRAKSRHIQNPNQGEMLRSLETLKSHQMQCSRHSIGNIPSKRLDSCGHESSTSMISLFPFGHFIFNSMNFPVTVSNLASADALVQSSQYHHFSCSPFHGGNAIHDICVQVVQGLVSPSPEKSTTLDAIMPATQTRRPKERKKRSLHL